MGNKTTQTAADQHTSLAVGELVKQPIFIINPSPYIKDPTDDESHRGNTPWIIAIPFLQVAFTAQRLDGSPVFGFYEDDDAKALAVKIWNLCKDDDKVLADYQKDNRWPSNFGSGYKLMQRFITVEPFDPA